MWRKALNDMVDQDNSNYKNGAKLMLFSGIPTTLYPLLFALGFSMAEPLEFASTLLIQVDATKTTGKFSLDDYNVNIRNDGKIINSILGLPLPATASDFIKTLDKIDLDLAQYNVKNLTQFCALHLPPTPVNPISPVGPKWKKLMWILFGISLFLIILSWIIVHTKDTIKEKILAQQKQAEEAENK
jgi:hypothetical protein